MTTEHQLDIAPGAGVRIDAERAAAMWPDGVPRYLTLDATVDCDVWLYGDLRVQLVRMARNRFGKRNPRAFAWPGSSSRARVEVRSAYRGTVTVAPWRDDAV